MSDCPIPALADLPVWLLWRSVPSAKGEKPRKLPFYADGTSRRGTLDSAEDRARLVDFAAASGALTAEYAGLGVALGEVPGEELHVSGIDLDNVRDAQTGELDERATAILGAAASYAEISPSGRGIKIFGTGALGTCKRMNCSAGLEIYSAGRFFTVTGRRVNSTAHLADLTDAARVARELFPDKEREASASSTGGKIAAGARNNQLTRAAGQMRRAGWSADRIASALQAVNTAECDPPLPEGEVAAIARSVGRYEPSDSAAEWQPPVVRTYGATFNAAAIPRRQWVLGNRYSRGEVTGNIGPPGVNKSMLMLTDAVAIATGRALLRDQPPDAGHGLLLVGEDARRDAEARLAAVCLQYRIDPAELADRLHAVYLSENDAERMMLALSSGDQAMLNASMLAWLRGFPNLTALFIDPMAVWHRLVENDNGAMAMLSASLRGLAVQAGCAVAYDHHVTKASMVDPEAHVRNLAAVRGGGAIAADFRWAFTLARLKPETAASLGIPDEERRLYRRLDPLKASYADDRDELRLLRVDTAVIANGEPVGVLVEVDTASQRAAGEALAEAEAVAHVEAVARALGRMLRQKRPRSMSEAVAWLMQHEPGLFRSAKTGEPLAERTLRGRLLAALGGGLEHEGRRIVCVHQGEGGGARQLIDFEQGGLLS